MDTRGDHGIQWLHTPAPDEVHLAAICDTCQPYIDRGIANVKNTWGNAPATYEDYRDLPTDKSIDAVYIMTPEHLHRNMAVDALNAGNGRGPSRRLAGSGPGPLPAGSGLASESGFEVVGECGTHGARIR